MIFPVFTFHDPNNKHFPLVYPKFPNCYSNVQIDPQNFLRFSNNRDLLNRVLNESIPLSRTFPKNDRKDLRALAVVSVT